MSTAAVCFQGDRAALSQLLDASMAAGKHNVAFMCLFLLGQVGDRMREAIQQCTVVWNAPALFWPVSKVWVSGAMLCCCLCSEIVAALIALRCHAC